MSGGGGGGGDWRPEPKAPLVNPTAAGGGGGIGGVPNDPCVIEETTNLNSVVAAALRNVRPGDLLDVVFLPGPPHRLVTQDRNGTTVGSITSRSMLQFIECIQNGRQYVAEVLAIQGGTCQIRVGLR